MTVKDETTSLLGVIAMDKFGKLMKTHAKLFWVPNGRYRVAPKVWASPMWHH